MALRDESVTNTTECHVLADSGQVSWPRGKKFGRYIIIELLATGGMGAVYHAYDPALNRGVALKILKVAHVDPDVATRAKARLLREAQALGQLSHPSVVAVHDVGSVGDDVFVAMELVEGQTLKHWMKVGHNLDEILAVMIAAGQGLAAAHKAGMVHRDFKPDNVMVGKDGRVQVLDFGLARGVDSVETAEPLEKKTSTDELDNTTSSASDLHKQGVIF